jgi:hypothetical protein
MANIHITKLLTVDNTGMPQAPSIQQIQDKDVMLLYTRDKSDFKSQYIKEAGVIYYLGDPQSPAHQQGLSEKEALKLAIENYNLPKDYVPDVIVQRLIDKYWHQNITEAGLAVETLRKSIHLISMAAIKINERLNTRLTGALADDDIRPILDLMNDVNKKSMEIPALVSALKSAYDNLKDEQENIIGRGNVSITSSMDADEG